MSQSLYNHLKIKKKCKFRSDNLYIGGGTSVKKKHVISRTAPPLRTTQNTDNEEELLAAGGLRSDAGVSSPVKLKNITPFKIFLSLQSAGRGRIHTAQIRYFITDHPIKFFFTS